MIDRIYPKSSIVEEEFKKKPKVSKIMEPSKKPSNNINFLGCLNYHTGTGTSEDI